MEELEKKCRKIAKEKGILIRKDSLCICAYYNMVVFRQRRVFHSWEDVLDFVEKFEE